jgi:proteasome accessory factor B
MAQGSKNKAILAGMPTARPPLERMLKIHSAILAEKYPNASNLAVDLEVSTKSIHRDIEFMRDRLNLPLEYSASRFGYRYTEEVNGFPSIQISEGELLSLFVAEKALQQYRGTPFEQPLMSAFKKLTAMLPDTVTLHLKDWDDSISFRTSAEPLLDLKVFDALAKAVSAKHKVVILYRKPGGRKATRRPVDPYHLSNINGEWFLFGYCHLRKDIRTFAPSRMDSVEVTQETFIRNEEFSVEKRLEDSFGVHSGKGEYRVRVRFDSFAADFIQEKMWHPSQKLLKLKNRQVELTLGLSSLIEVERWILSWGEHAVVLEPEELKESIFQSASRIIENSQSIR